MRWVVVAYFQDPALHYKINGIPVAKPISGLSLPIGEGQNKLEVGWVHQRKAALTGKMYAKGLGTFYDEYLSPLKSAVPPQGRTGTGSP